VFFTFASEELFDWVKQAPQLLNEWILTWPVLVFDIVLFPLPDKRPFVQSDYLNLR